jgi:hypothetical protein
MPGLYACMAKPFWNCRRVFATLSNRTTLALVT